MLSEPKCYKRKCKHFIGVIQPDGTEMTETNACKAFPKGIPADIAYGDNKHLKVFPNQGNAIIFEKRRTVSPDNFALAGGTAPASIEDLFEQVQYQGEIADWRNVRKSK